MAAMEFARGGGRVGFSLVPQFARREAAAPVAIAAPQNSRLDDRSGVAREDSSNMCARSETKYGIVGVQGVFVALRRGERVCETQTEGMAAETQRREQMRAAAKRSKRPTAIRCNTNGQNRTSRRYFRRGRRSV